MHNKFSTAKYRCGHLALLPDNFFCKIKKFVDEIDKRLEKGEW